jgi:hypothetical protein
MISRRTSLEIAEPPPISSPFQGEEMERAGGKPDQNDFHSSP